MARGLDCVRLQLPERRLRLTRPAGQGRIVVRKAVVPLNGPAAVPFTPAINPYSPILGATPPLVVPASQAGYPILPGQATTGPAIAPILRGQGSLGVAAASPASPRGVRDGVGYTPRSAMDLLPATDETSRPRRDQSNVDQLEDFGRSMRNAAGAGLVAIAERLGGTYFVGDLSASADTKFTHDRRATPSLIVVSVDLGGLGGSVLGSPGGGPNATAWNAREIFVRATADGRYAFVVI